MLDKEKINSYAPLVKHSYPLKNREHTENFLKDQFRVLIDVQKEGVSDRTKMKIPLIGGISGVGKTVILESCGGYLNSMNVGSYCACIVPYYNGRSVQPGEVELPVHVSFCLRLLYRLFLDNNTRMSFETYMHEFPVLYVDEIIMAIVLQDIKNVLWSNLNDTTILLIGIDEYQTIEGIANTKDGLPMDSLLNMFIDTMVNSKTTKLVLLPVLAGTSFNTAKMLSASGMILRVPMPMVNPVDILDAVRSSTPFVVSPLMRACVYKLSTPRPVAEFATAVAATEGAATIQMDDDSCLQLFQTTHRPIRPEKLSNEAILMLVATAVARVTIAMDGIVYDKVTWMDLRNRGWFMADEVPGTGLFYVLIQYNLLGRLADTELPTSASTASWKERSAVALCAAAKYGDRLIESSSTLQQWQLWEMFGVWYEAMRINSLLYLGHEEVAVSRLYEGCTINGCEQRVCLEPVTIMKLEAKSVEQLSDERKLTSCIFLNCDGGDGHDYFFHLKVAENKHVMIKNQRKRKHGAMGVKSISHLVRSAIEAPPKYSSSDDVVVGICSLLATSKPSADDLPVNSYFLGIHNLKQYHGSFVYHPAATPLINVHYAGLSDLKHVLTGSEINKGKVAVKMLESLQKSATTVSRDECQALLKKLNAELSVDVVFNEFAMF